MGGVEILEQRPGRLVKLTQVERPLVAGGNFTHRAQPLGHLGGRAEDLVAAFLPGLCTLNSTRGKPGMPRESVGG